MKKALLFVSCSLFIFLTATGQTKVAGCQVENFSNPVGLDTKQPRFTWQLASTQRGVLQTAYEIRVAKSAASAKSGKELTWHSGKVNNDSSVQVAYKGSPLQSGQRYFWQVRVWDNQGKASDWSTPAFFQMALLSPADWKAKWIEPGYTEDSVLRPSPFFRKTFQSRNNIQAATAYWYRGNLAWGGQKDVYGKNLGLLLQLHITYKDGRQETIISDESWKSTTADIRYSEIYHGETIDARLQKKGWATTTYNDKNWDGVKLAAYPMDNLLATANEPVKKGESFQPVKIFTTPKGEKVIDFGQNLVGWVVVKAAGKAGDTIRINHAEVLDKAGNFYTENLRAAKAEANYILAGGGEEVFEPHFTFYGFRYIKVTGYPGDIKPENFTAVSLYSGMKKAGSFTSSHTLLNQLVHNIEWGQKGNFLDVPTDCPQRDERLGWTGDAQV
ncbi:MAG: alpha-L-rhamnosidase, partial [Chitinophagaceae bacterium]